MKIIVSMEEVKKIVAQHLKAQGLPIAEHTSDFKRHTEGQYDESVEVIDGLSFELDRLQPHA